VSDLSLLLSQTRTVETAQRASESATTIPPDADTMSILELGDRSDSTAFLKAMTRRTTNTGLKRNPRVFNVTPPGNPGYKKLPTPIRGQTTTFYRGPAPDWWLDRFVVQSPNWVYLSGHFGERRRHSDPSNTTHLYNEGTGRDPENFSLNFSNPTVNNNRLWRRMVENSVTIDGVTYEFALKNRCRCVLIMGCSAIHPDVRPAVLNIQKMLTGPSGPPPIILGFWLSCPIEKEKPTAPLCKHFVNALDRDWSRRHKDEHIADSWMMAALKWEEPQEPNRFSFAYSRRVGYLSRSGIGFRLDFNRSTGQIFWNPKFPGFE
jgi:hypothetical protein